MSDATTWSEFRSRFRLNARAILRTATLAALWAGFLSWCWIVLRSPAIVEVIAALERLGLVLATYLVALTVWITVRTWIHQNKGDRISEPFLEPAFDSDYFGRRVATADGASFADQHLVLEYSDGQKVYKPGSVEEEEQVAAAASLQSLAAAAGAHGSVAPAANDAAEQELDARSLRSH